MLKTCTCSMGSACTTRSSTVDAADPSEQKADKPLVPYIVVSSVSLSRKLLYFIAGIL